MSVFKNNKLMPGIMTLTVLVTGLFFIPNIVKAQDSPQIDKIFLVDMSFAKIPAGEFQMGSESGSDNEKPVHQVKISQAFWMQTTEVTQMQWMALMGNNPSRFYTCYQCPVERVSWSQVQSFIKKLNNQMKDGSTYRLPTEAEWDYAARGGTTGDYVGNLDLDSMVWYSKNSGSKTHPVGTKSANGWGLYDMYGNVWEWVEDRYGKYPSGSVTDPKGGTASSYRVFRGGSWTNSGSTLRSEFRGFNSPENRSDLLGFRLVRDPK